MGIVFYKSFGFEISLFTYCVIIGILLILSFQLKRTTYFASRQTTIIGIFFFFFLIVSGNQLSKTGDSRQSRSDITNHYKSANYLLGKVIKSWKTETTFRFIFELSTIKESEHWRPVSGQIMLISTDSINIEIGDELIVKNKIREIVKPQKKYLVDYSKYYTNQGLFLQQFIKTNDITLIDANKGVSFWFYSQLINSKFETILGENLDTLSFGILNALVLGDKGGLDQETKTKFSEGGIMHILAVSGLHVGILFIILHAIFGFLKKLRTGKIFYYCIMFFALWSYALIAGWSNSVVRATIMFSLFLIAEIIDRKHYPINTAAFSAFLVLSLNPNALYQISFQLSYAAVFSIILLYKPVYKQLKINNTNLDYFWKIVCVSIAAQIGTLPITLYYFKIFQPAFLVFNVIAIPLAFVLLLSGFSIIAFSPVKVVSGLLGKILDIIIYLFDGLVEILNSISPAVQNIQISITQVFLCYLIIFTFNAFLCYKKLSYYFITIAFALLFFGIELNNKWKVKNQSGAEFVSKNEFIIYQGEDYFIHSFKDDYSVNKSVEAFKNYYSLKNEKTFEIFNTSRFSLIVYDNKKILLLKDTTYGFPDTLVFDYVLINQKISDKQKNYFETFTQYLVTL